MWDNYRPTTHSVVLCGIEEHSQEEARNGWDHADSNESADVSCSMQVGGELRTTARATEDNDMKRRVHERRSLLNNYPSPSDKQREDYFCPNLSSARANVVSSGTAQNQFYSS